MKREEIGALKRGYPGKNIVLLPENDPQEVIVELGNSGEDAIAVALIDRSQPHFHRKTVEHYCVQRGTLKLHLDGEIIVLTVGGVWTVRPGQVHWAEGDATRVLVTSTPPWSPEDHILVESE